MADLRKTCSFACFRRPEQTRRSSKPVAKPPAEDAANFSYLVEDRILEQGDEHEVYHKFVTELVDDAMRFSEEVSTYPYLRNTKGSAGADLFHLTNEISYFKGEMDKIERELTTLDFGPKELAVLEVVLRIARDRFDNMSKPGELRSCVEGLVSMSILHPLQTRKNRAALTKSREGLIEARELSAQCRIGMIREHRDQGKLKNIKANVREVMLPAGQSKPPKSQEPRPRLLRRISTPWSSASTSSLRAAQPPRVDLSVGTARVLERKGSERTKAEKKDMAAAFVATPIL